MPIKISTLNLCLGLQFKVNLVKQLINDESIDVLCMQETEIKNNINKNNLSYPGFNIEIENNSIISRTAIFVKNTVKYERRREFEGIDSNLTIIDVKGKETVRIINLYRSFAPANGRTVRENFTYLSGSSGIISIYNINSIDMRT